MFRGKLENNNKMCLYCVMICEKLFFRINIENVNSLL